MFLDPPNVHVVLLQIWSELFVDLNELFECRCKAQGQKKNDKLEEIGFENY